MWGSSFMFNKIGVASLPPLSLVAARISVAAVVLLVLLKWQGVRLPASAPTWLGYTLLGIVGNIVPFFLITWGQQTVPSAVAGILMAIMPLATLVLAHFFVAGERLSLQRAAGFAVGFCGIVVLFGPDAHRVLSGLDGQLLAKLAVLAGALCYAANSILARRLVRSDFLAAATGTMLISTLIAVPLALSVEQPWRAVPSAASLGAALWLGVGPTAVATILYFKLISSAGPTFMSLVNYLSPALAVLLGVGLLGEELSAQAYFGLGLILAGSALSQWRQRQQVLKKS